MWLLPILAIGALVYLAKSGKSQPAQRALPPPPAYYPAPEYAPPPQHYVPHHHQQPPSPMAVLIQYIQSRRQPPQMVIMCALAQAEQMGRFDIANDIVRMFVVPSRQAEVHRVHTARPAGGEPAPAHAHPAPAHPSPEPTPAPVAEAAQQPTPAAPAPPAPAPRPTSQLSDDEIQAMLNSDPARFVSRAQRNEVIDVPSSPPHAPAPHAPAPHAPAPKRQHGNEAGTVIGGVPALAASPIRGIQPVAWSRFCEGLTREDPSFVSGRHVGQYRQNKNRLEELGIDPDKILGSPEAQRAALERDLADSYRRARSGGLTSAVHQQISLPDHDEPVMITLSGVLGVIQAAGIDGASSWLQNHRDRERFPHTTRAFLRTNGVF